MISMELISVSCSFGLRYSREEDRLRAQEAIFGKCRDLNISPENYTWTVDDRGVARFFVQLNVECESCFKEVVISFLQQTVCSFRVVEGKPPVRNEVYVSKVAESEPTIVQNDGGETYVWKNFIRRNRMNCQFCFSQPRPDCAVS